ncbi:hypothetical protein ACET3Z_025966 [Daucus carota]
MGTDQNSPPPERWHFFSPENNHFQLHGKALVFMLIRGLASLAFLTLFLYFFFCRFPRATAKEDVDADLIRKQLPVVFYGALKKEVSVIECCICLGFHKQSERLSKFQSNQNEGQVEEEENEEVEEEATKDETEIQVDD